MAYIGQGASSRYVTRNAVQQFNGDGSTTAFTLNQTVTADQDILVSVDGVIQDNSAYTVSNGTYYANSVWGLIWEVYSHRLQHLIKHGRWMD